MTLDVGLVLTSMSRLGGGVATYVREVAKRLQAAGCDVSIYAVRDRFSEQDMEAWLPLRPQVFESRLPAIIGYAPAMGRAIASHDLLHQHGIWQGASVAVRQWGRASGNPIMISPHGMLDPWAKANSGFRKWCAGVAYENANLRNASCMHALTTAELRDLRKAGLKAPIATIASATQLPEPCEQIALPGCGRKTLLFLARLHPKKGLSELLTAWGILSREHPDLSARWRVVIAGWDDGGHREALMAQAASLPDVAQVEIPGALHGAEKHAAFCAADAFILPSFSEGLPIAVLEAWAYGVPVFMTQHCNLPEGFARDAAVRISTDPSELAQVLAARLEDDGLPAMAERARALCEEEFTWDRVAAQYLATYNWLLGQGEQPAFVSVRA